MRTQIALFLLLNLLGLLSHAQNTSSDTTSRSEFELLIDSFRNQTLLDEKVYLHFDRPFYAAGDVIWFKAYVIESYSLLPLGLSGSLYVDLTDPSGNIIDHIILQIHEDGYAFGDFELPPNLVSGQYQVRAYTDRMVQFGEASFFTENLPVLKAGELSFDDQSVSELKVEFFPEGGNLIADLPTRMSFRIHDNYQKPVKLSGIIMKNGEKEVEIHSDENGMGDLFFKPDPDIDYTATFNYLNKVWKAELPKVLPRGIAIGVLGSDTSSINVRVVCTPEYYGTQVYLTGRIRDRIYFHGKGNINSGILYFKIPKKDLPSGILRLTAFDKNLKPQSERLFSYVGNTELVSTSITANTNLASGESGAFDITLLHGDEPVKANLSLSVLDGTIIAYDELKKDDFVQYLILKSDLDRIGINSRFPFPESFNDKTRDLFLLSTAWDRFDWLDHTNSDPQFESGLTICGVLQGATPRRNSAADFSLVVIDENTGMYTASLDPDKKLCFKNVFFTDTATLIVQYEKKNKQWKDARVNFIQHEPPGTSYSSPNGLYSFKMANSSLPDYFDFLNSIDTSSFKILDEVVLESQPLESIIDRKSELGATQVIEFDESDNSRNDVLQALNGRILGFRAEFIGPNPSVTLFKQGTRSIPLFLVDNVPTTPDIIASIRPNEVERVDFFYGADASLYGIRGAPGVISITLRKGVYYEDRSAIHKAKVVGYYSPKNFESYQEELESNFRINSQTTIYWNPVVFTNENGKATVSFKNPIGKKSYTVVIKGISSTGELIEAVVPSDQIN